MGKRLSDEERARRILGKVHLRPLGGAGKCQTCSRKIKKGEQSLRYYIPLMGRSQEVGICLECARKFWKHAENIVGRISAGLGLAGPTEQPAPVVLPSAGAKNQDGEPAISAVNPPVTPPGFNLDALAVEIRAVRKRQNDLGKELYGSTWKSKEEQEG